MLDVILYSREQILKEKTSMPSEDKSDEIPDVPWGIISIKAQVCSLHQQLPVSACHSDLNKVMLRATRSPSGHSRAQETQKTRGV